MNIEDAEKHYAPVKNIRNVPRGTVKKYHPDNFDLNEIIGVFNFKELRINQKLFLFLYLNDGLTTHIGPESLRYSDGAVLVEIILKKCNEHSRRSGNGVVEGMSEVFLSALALYSDTKPSCLSVA